MEIDLKSILSKIDGHILELYDCIPLYQIFHYNLVQVLKSHYLLWKSILDKIDHVLELDIKLPEERIAQEVAILLIKGDVREELDRLRIHINSLEELLAGGGVIGRKLEFACQELGREANTICSKTNNIQLSRIGIELKTLIDEMREQVQNIE